jgi:hypothetical protein
VPMFGVFVLVGAAMLFVGVVVSWGFFECTWSCLPVGLGVFAGTFVPMFFVGEFDPGSGRTLAACLTHASRAVRPFGVHERRTGE